MAPAPAHSRHLWRRPRNRGRRKLIRGALSSWRHPEFQQEKRPPVLHPGNRLIHKWNPLRTNPDPGTGVIFCIFWLTNLDSRLGFVSRDLSAFLMREREHKNETGGSA